MNLYKILGLSLIMHVSAIAQNKEDIAAIKGQCGCFNVDFKYAETFSPNKEYEFHERYHAKATEYVFVLEETNKKIVIQHLLAINDTMVVKHWREDWVYENKDLFSFNKDKSWNYSAEKPLAVKNTWTQKVFQTDDSPRYEGIAQWFHGNGTHLWESKVDAPLPRREYTKRNDYNVMQRGNRIYITDQGYMHEQDNDKILREDGQADLLIAQEKGFNEYIRTEAEKCESTQKWWEENKDFWTDVRAAWQEVFDQKKSFSIKHSVDDRRINSYFDKIEKAKMSSAENRKALREMFSKFIVYENGI